MRTWSIHYWADNTKPSSVETWLDDLTPDQFTSVAKELKLLERCGNTLRLPHSRPLGQSLFELRERQFGYRIYYSFLADYRIILLHAGDKKSQKKDITLARKRLATLLIHT